MGKIKQFLTDVSVDNTLYIQGISGEGSLVINTDTVTTSSGSLYFNDEAVVLNSEAVLINSKIEELSGNFETHHHDSQYVDISGGPVYGDLSVVGNISGSSFYGDGTNLTGIATDAELSAYTLLTTTADISGNLENQISTKLPISTFQALSGHVDLSTLVTNVASISADLVENYLTSSSIADISGNLQSQIYTKLDTSVFASLSGSFLTADDDSVYATNISVASISANLESQINNKLDTSVFASLSGSGSSVDLSAVTESIIPNVSGAYDLGSATKPWKDLYVTENSLYMGNTQVTIDSGNLNVGGKVIPSVLDNNLNVNEETILSADTTFTNSISGENLVFEESSPSSVQSDAWLDVIYANGKFVAVGTGTNKVMTSKYGNVWETQTPASENNWYGVAYGSGLYVAVSYNGTNRVMTSPDGISWTARSAGDNDQNWRGIAYGNGLFVAVGEGSQEHIMTSSDGINWIISTAFQGNALTKVAYGNGLFVAVGGGGIIIKSINGVDWTQESISSASYTGITYGNGLFVASQASASQVKTSPDGSSWTPRSVTASHNTWYGVRFCGDRFLLVGNATSDKIMESTDGINWSSISYNDGTSDELRTAVFGAERKVIVGSGGTSRVIHSQREATNVNHLYINGGIVVGNPTDNTNKGVGSINAEMYYGDGSNLINLPLSSYTPLTTINSISGDLQTSIDAKLDTTTFVALSGSVSIHGNDHVSGIGQGGYTIEEQFTTVTDEVDYKLGSNDNGLTIGGFAQSFQLTSSADIKRVSFYIKKYGTPAEGLIVSIQTDNSGAPSATLAHANLTQTVVEQNIPSTAGWLQVEFDNAGILNSSTTYWLVVETITLQSGGIGYTLYGDTDNTYPAHESLINISAYPDYGFTTGHNLLDMAFKIESFSSSIVDPIPVATNSSYGLASPQHITDIETLQIAFASISGGSGLVEGDLATLTSPIATTGNISGASFYGDGSNLTGISTDLTPYTLLTTTNAISANLESQINDKLDTSVFASLSGSGGSSIDLSAVTESIIPNVSGAYDLGSASKPWRDLYVTGNSINMGSNVLSVNGNVLQLDNKNINPVDNVTLEAVSTALPAVAGLTSSTLSTTWNDSAFAVSLLGEGSYFDDDVGSILYPTPVGSYYTFAIYFPETAISATSVYMSSDAPLSSFSVFALDEATITQIGSVVTVSGTEYVFKIDVPASSPVTFEASINSVFFYLRPWDSNPLENLINLRVKYSGVDTGQLSSAIQTKLGYIDQNVKTNGTPTFNKVTSTTGILFGADTAAANTLDDYEEGTWTPVIAVATSGSVDTYSVQIGTYTKIGNTVIANGFLTVSSVTSPLGATSITGLPFSNGSGTSVVVSLWPDQINGVNANAVVGQIASSESTIMLYDASAASVSALPGTVWISSANIRFQAIYKV